jgi:hypothetical protein
VTPAGANRSMRLYLKNCDKNASSAGHEGNGHERGVEAEP